MTDDATSTTGDRVVVVVAVLLHLLIGVFPIAATGLLAPPWFVAVAGIGWGAAGVLLWRLRRTAPRRTWLVPVGVLAAWFALVTLGDVLLGWTA